MFCDAHVYLVTFYIFSAAFPDAFGTGQYFFPVQGCLDIQKTKTICLSRCPFNAVRITDQLPK